MFPPIHVPEDNPNKTWVRFAWHDGSLGIEVFDLYSAEHPLYIFSINNAGIKTVLGLDPGSALILPGSTFSDFLAFQETGELPAGIL